MKKFTTLLLLTLASICLFGCGEEERTINRLSRSLEIANESSEHFMAEVETLTAENDELRYTIDQLKAELAKQGAAIDEAESKDTQTTTTYVVDSDDSDNYLAVKFWSNGKTYVGSSVVTWYSDYYCSQQITSEVIIISPTIDRLKLSNGHWVYTCMSSNGLVFSTDDPYLRVRN